MSNDHKNVHISPFFSLTNLFCLFCINHVFIQMFNQSQYGDYGNKNMIFFYYDEF